MTLHEGPERRLLPPVPSPMEEQSCTAAVRKRLWRRSGGTSLIATSLTLILYGGLVLVVLATDQAVAAVTSKGGNSGCPHPAVPSGASYVNISGGLGADSWRIKYDCDIGKIFYKIQNMYTIRENNFLYVNWFIKLK
jgi:hypothetical protein